MSRSKQKGTTWETKLARWFREHGFPNADRSPLRGAQDRGDLVNVGPFVIEAKDCARLDLRAWCDEVRAEMQNAELPFGFVALKRSGTQDPGDAYAIMRLRDMAVLMEIVAAVRQ